MKSRLVMNSLGWVFVPYAVLSVINSAGNPGGDAYAGQPGSSYDAAANPPHANGVVTYNPDTPLPASTQSDMSTGMSGASPSTATPGASAPQGQ